MEAETPLTVSPTSVVDTVALWSNDGDEAPSAEHLNGNSPWAEHHNDEDPSAEHGNHGDHVELAQVGATKPIYIARETPLFNMELPRGGEACSGSGAGTSSLDFYVSWMV